MLYKSIETNIWFIYFCFVIREQGPNVIGEVPPVRADNVTEANPSQYESDREDFFGFEAHDLITTTTGITVGQTVQTNTETKQSVSYRATPSNTSDSKEVDDEIIFIENNVEVIEIDDDEDNEVIGLNILECFFIHTLRQHYLLSYRSLKRLK